MGSSSSKPAARQLPRSKPTQNVASAAARQAQTNLQRLQSEAANPSPSSSSPSTSSSEPSSSSSTSAKGYGRTNYGPHTPNREDRLSGRVYSSEAKDETIIRDAQDPHFLANLSRLGQVAVPKPGTPFEKSAPALRTILSRTSDPTFTSDSALPPKGYASSTSLSDLLDQLKEAPASKHAAIASKFGMDIETVNRLRKWVNSPSVDRAKTTVKMDEHGDEEVTMAAIWVDTASPESSVQAAAKVIPPPSSSSTTSTAGGQRRSYSTYRKRDFPSRRSFSTSSSVANSSVSSIPAPGSAVLRFAPSPTGYLHLGGLRTALFNHLLARKWKGKWILRIEDTDRNRLVPDAISNLQSTLEWAGLEYDEGPDKPGSVGPYIQSERLESYRHHTKHLVENDKAYRCFCTPSELAEIRQQQLRRRANTSYDGRCRHLTEEEVTRRVKSGQEYVVRYKSTGERMYIPPDLIFGTYSASLPPTESPKDKSWSRPASSSLVEHNGRGKNGPGAFSAAAHHEAFNDDFVLVKSDGYPTYHLANVIDDHLMGITHVLRGEEWLPSTPKHVQLYEAFGWNLPAFAHLPLLVNPDGTKLSKRTGDVRVEHYRDLGYEPSALVNFVALMGFDHQHRSDLGDASEHPFFPSDASLPSLSSAELRRDLNSLSELFTMTSLIEAFDLERVTHRRAAVFMPKLDWLNKMHLRRETLVPSEASNSQGRERLVGRLQDILKEVKPLQDNPLVQDREYVGKVLDADLGRATLLTDMAKQSIFFFVDPDLDNHEANSMAQKISPLFYSKVMHSALSQMSPLPTSDTWSTESNMWGIINHVVEEVGARKRSEVVMPLRHALTGRKSGPSLPALMLVLGPERCLQRIGQALRWLEREHGQSDMDEEIS